MQSNYCSINIKLIVFLIIVLTIPSSSLFGQGFRLAGIAIDSMEKEPVFGLTIQLVSLSDSNIQKKAVTDFDGQFTFSNLEKGRYSLTTFRIGYKPYRKMVRILDANVNLGNVHIDKNTQALKTVTIEGIQSRAEQNGDTTSFNASAFKTNPDATAEDLLNKMPGISTEGGTLKANGEQVKKILVDGKPFFGDDPNAAIKNLPSEIIDKIQVYDQGSEQTQFTGFDDGNNEKAINIITKRGRNNGVFGRISSGYGLDEKINDSRYLLGGNINFFNGDRRISLVGLSNNVNQQNFSADDLLGVSASNNSSRGGGRGGRGGGGDPSNFLVNQQGGINKTQSAGINYSDAWTKKLKVSGSYFFNEARNSNSTEISRNYILQNQDSSLVYNEQGQSKSKNINHRFAMRGEWSIDSNNSIVFSPKISLQQNESNNYIDGSNLFNKTIKGSSLQNQITSLSNGLNFSNNLLFRHKFAKAGRTFSANIDTRINTKNSDGTLYSANDYIDSTTVTDQQSTLNNRGNTIGANINYTESLNKQSQLQLNYNPSITYNESKKNTFNRDLSAAYNDLDSGLSNRFDNQYQTQKAGIGLRYNASKLSINTSIDGQMATLIGTQTFPNSLEVKREFFNLLPRASLNYKFSKTENLRLFYRSRTNAPSISQLQNLVDNSNPLQLKLGNPDLQQEFSHSMNMRYGKTKTGKGNSFFFFGNASITKNYIGNSTLVNREGVQTTMPINLNGYFSSNLFGTYSLVLKKIKSNLNLNSGLNYSQTPSLINNVLNKAKNTAVNSGFVLSSNISENVDFTISFNGAYNIANNSSQSQTNFNYYSQTSSAKFNWIFLKGFVFNTNLNHNLFSGLGEAYDRQFLLWNASIGHKFLKNKALLAEFYVFDILDQNNSISRSINDYYVEDNRTTVLQRFGMIKLNYTIRSFKGSAQLPKEERDDDRPPPPPNREFRGGGRPDGSPDFRH